MPPEGRRSLRTSRISRLLEDGTEERPAQPARRCRALVAPLEQALSDVPRTFAGRGRRQPRRNREITTGPVVYAHHCPTKMPPLLSPMCVGCGGRNPEGVDECGWCGRPLRSRHLRHRRLAKPLGAALMLVAALGVALLLLSSAVPVPLGG